jgi:hypothetical protein
MVAPWRRDSYVIGGGAGQIALIALSAVKLPDPLPVSRGRHGMPDDGDGPESIALVARDRAADPAWFDEQVLAPFADLIASDLGPQAAASALAAAHAYVIEAELADPDDLGHIQAAWALAKCVCEEGAVVVIDVHAARAHLAGEVAALVPDRSFDVMHEVTLFFDEQPDGLLAAWSLGLRKFGRPDLVLLGVPPDAATEAALILRDIAATLADGERLEPGDRIATPGGAAFATRAFEPAMSEIVAVDGPALLLESAPEAEPTAEPTAEPGTEG